MSAENGDRSQTEEGKANHIISMIGSWAELEGQYARGRSDMHGTQNYLPSNTRCAWFHVGSGDGHAFVTCEQDQPSRLRTRDPNPYTPNPNSPTPRIPNPRPQIPNPEVLNPKCLIPPPYALKSPSLKKHAKISTWTELPACGSCRTRPKVPGLILLRSNSTNNNLGGPPPL